MKKYVIEDINCPDVVSGVYGIIHYKDKKIYIGSSYDVFHRLREHVRGIIGGWHSNEVLSKVDASNLSFVILDYCEEADLLDCEHDIINKFSPSQMYNSSLGSYNLKDLKPWLERSIEKGDMEKYKVSENGCWEWVGGVDKGGYGKFNVSVRSKKKTLKPHRVMYYKEYKEYPKLIRHTCHNRLCMNPNHLLSGSSRQNANDSKIIRDKDFETAYVEFEGDKIKLTKHFGFKPTKNRGKQLKYSYYVNTHIKNLGLREKYPQFIPEKVKRKRKKPSKIKTKGLLMARRGPKRKKVIDEVIHCWLCIEDYVDGKKHRWECTNCGVKRVTTKSNIRSTYGCVVCRTFPSLGNT
jgi:hypothetical protein